MTVWTKVTLEDVNRWLSYRDLGRATAIEPIEQGSEDSVFRLIIDGGTPVFLRLFERTNPLAPLGLAAQLAVHGLPVCPPLADAKERFMMSLNGKPAALFPWIDGKWTAEPSLANIEAAGAFLGHMGRIGLDHGSMWKHENPRGQDWFVATVRMLGEVADSGTREELESELAAQESFWIAVRSGVLPQGPVHGDFFRDNVLFDANGGLAAVIDWGFCACPSPLVLDLAIAANDWCLRKDSFELDPGKLGALLRGRTNVLPLTESEQSYWIPALRLAALRFWLSRLHDWHFPRDSQGKRLDPGHFRGILQARRRMGMATR